MVGSFVCCLRNLLSTQGHEDISLKSFIKFYLPHFKWRLEKASFCLFNFSQVQWARGMAEQLCHMPAGAGIWTQTARLSNYQLLAIRQLLDLSVPRFFRGNSPAFLVVFWWGLIILITENSLWHKHSLRVGDHYWSWLNELRKKG